LSQTIHLSIDAMGGDLGPRLSVPASLSFLKKHPNVSITLVGDLEQIRAELGGFEHSQLKLAPSEGLVSMSDKPGAVLRRGKSTSMWQAVEMVANGSAQGCLSAGNTGALMAISRHLLGMREGFDRPAICKAMPSKGGACQLLDLGANIECSPELLAQFAVLGVETARVAGHERSRVGLLNIGVEDQKGYEDLHVAAKLMAEDGSYEFIGFVEADQIYSGVADVIVCDGFAGNVALKASEGVVRYIRREIKQWYGQTWFRKALGLMFWPLLLSFHSRFDPDRYNGACFVGLNGVVVKSHGGANKRGYEYALSATYAYALNRSIAT